MTRPSRNLLLCDDSYFHVAWRCHNKDWLLNESWTKRCYYDLLLRYTERYSMIFHAYHMMENHVHLIGRLKTVEAFSCFFRTVNNLFSRLVNGRFKRAGQVIMDRFKSPRIEDDRHLLSVMIYNDLNGVRAGRDNNPEDSAYSSYQYYAYGKADDLLLPAPSYLALAPDEKQRQVEYRALVASMMRHRTKPIP